MRMDRFVHSKENLLKKQEMSSCYTEDALRLQIRTPRPKAGTDAA
jgi:hypothetical protein